MVNDDSCHLSCYTYDRQNHISVTVPDRRMRLSGTVTEIWRLEDNGVTTLTFWGHVTSSVT